MSSFNDRGIAVGEIHYEHQDAKSKMDALVNLCSALPEYGNIYSI